MANAKLFTAFLIIMLLVVPTVSRENLSAEVLTHHFDSITVVSDDNYPPFIFRDAGESLKGILVDQWKLWEKKTGIKVKLIGMNWADAQEFIQQDKADVIDTMFVTKERKPIYDFSKSYAKIEVPIFFHKNISGINSIISVKGFSIAVKKGDAAIEIFHQNGIVDELVRYDSYEEIIKRVAENKIRLFCIDKPPALYFLNKYNLVEEYKYSDALYTGEFHRAVKKGRVDLLSTIEDGFSRISKKEYSVIDQKWYGKTIAATPGYVKYLGVILGMIVIIFAILLLFSLFLRSQVRKKTSDLSKTNLLLEERETFLRSLLNFIPDIVWVKDKDGVYLGCNYRLESLFGVKANKIRGKTDYDFVDRELADFFRQKDKEAIDTGKPSIYEEEFTFADDGHRELLETIKTPMFNFDGELIGVLGIAHDITDRKQTENKIKASLKEKETLLHEIHHRVKNNMQVINSLLQLQLNSIEDDTIKGILRESKNRIYAMAAVHETLHGSEKLSEIDLKTYLSKITTDIFQTYSTDSGKVKLYSNVENSPISLNHAYPLGLTINELVSNSLKYAFPGERVGEITVSMMKLDKKLELIVKDDGVGMPESFDWKNPNSLGLKIVRTLVENQLDGSIDLDNTNGTKFTIKFNIET